MKQPLAFVRISDLARAYVGWSKLEPRPYQQHYGPAEVQHDARRIAIANHPLAQNLLDTLPKYMQRLTGNIVVKGCFDGLRIVHDYRLGEDLVSLVEFKTTLYDASDTTINMAVFQLQLYVWMLKPYIEQRGLRLHVRHYVEVIHRQTGELLERIPVNEDPHVEEVIWELMSEKDGITTSPFLPKEVKA